MPTYGQTDRHEVADSRFYQFFNVSLTVHLSITLANDQRVAQIFLIQLLQYLAHPQEVKLY